ncbi:MAG: transcriptional regulator NrdR [Clostridia bacterium]|nr:transcriptional regulator NrdR [Clostridia bacterium]
MKCPFCSNDDSKVIDSRPTEEGAKIRRRRECTKCGQRFTTYEIVESVPLIVIKKDNSREPFDREKLFRGIMAACEKRPVSAQKMDEVVNNIESKLQNSLEREVRSAVIGELVMEALKDLDEVAYVRFASVYRHFSDIDTFMEEIVKLKNKKD